MKLLKNLNLLRPCSEKPYLENAYLVIEDDTFLSISTSEPGGEFEEVSREGAAYERRNGAQPQPGSEWEYRIY